MSVYELKPTMLSCRQPSQNRFCSALTNVALTARTAACAGFSGPALTRTAATCHSSPCAARSTTAPTASCRAHASARPRVQPMHATARPGADCGARLCPRQPRRSLSDSRVEWVVSGAGCKRTHTHLPSDGRCEQLCVTTSMHQKSKRCAVLCSRAVRALLARRARRVARRRKASRRRKRARRGHPRVVARRRHCAHGEGASAQPSRLAFPRTSGCALPGTKPGGGMPGRKPGGGTAKRRLRVSSRGRACSGVCTHSREAA